MVAWGFAGRHPFRFSIATAVVLAGCAAMLAVVSGGRAGTNPGDYTFVVQPPYVTESADGFAKGLFTPIGASATHTAMSFDIPNAFTVSVPSNCSGPPATSPAVDAGYTRYTCTLGTVNKNSTAKQSLMFTAPALDSPQPYTFKGFVTFDNGNGGNGSGGGSVTMLPVSGVPLTAQTTVVVAGDPKHGGSCDGSAETTSVSAGNLQNSTLSGAVASSSANVPCPWVVVGVNANPETSTALSQISSTGFVKTDAAATWTIEFYSLPVAFSKAKFLFDAAYTAGGSVFAGTQPPACVNGALGPTQTYCLLSFTKNGKGATAIVLLLGTGGDPGAGLG
jgi:hypothetical protein